MRLAFGPGHVFKGFHNHEKPTAFALDFDFLDQGIKVIARPLIPVVGNFAMSDPGVMAHQLPDLILGFRDNTGRTGFHAFAISAGV